eukprot:maker-scaffold_9-snap-gene-2.66-mRNA-1 protein AED:0.02 eAED:0.02 QI:0/0.66/0.5/1/1/1/4/179/667
MGSPSFVKSRRDKMLEEKSIDDDVSKNLKPEDESLDGLLELLKDFPNFEKLKTKILALPKKQQIIAINYALQKQKKSKEIAQSQAQAASEGNNEVELISQKHLALQELLNATRLGQTSNLKQILSKYKDKTLVNAAVSIDGDPLSHPLLHWAALDGQQESLTFLLQNGADPCAKNERGEIALHWAALKGHARIINLLVRANASTLSVVDSQGYSVLHHAAQYGQKDALAQILFYDRIKVDIRDNCGRTALHWATYKQKYYTIEFLLHKGAEFTAQDWEDMSPLHWAVVQGDHIACLILLRAAYKNRDSTSLKMFLDIVDKDGRTAEELANEKMESAMKHEKKRFKRVARLLQETAKRGSVDLGLSVHKKHWSWYCWPVIGPLATFYFFMYILPSPYMAGHYMLALFTVLASVGMWISWASLQRKDPGYIKRLNGAFTSKGEYLHDMYKEVMSKGLEVPVCTTCEIVRPLRSKHDRISDRCLEKFDHFCPWVGQPIAKENYLYFVALLVCTEICIVGFLVCAVYSLDLGHGVASVNIFQPLTLLVCSLLFFALYAGGLVLQHFMLVARNLTTNEFVNLRKYKYLKNGKNHFSQGLLKNLAEFLGLIEGKKVNLKKYYGTEFSRGSTKEERTRLIRESELDEDVSYGVNYSITQSNGGGLTADSFNKIL